MDENKIKEEKLFNQLNPKIEEYFTKNKNLEKGKIKEFIEFINFPKIFEFNDNNSLELFFKEISKNSNGKFITKELFIKNLIEYIHNHNEELFEKDISLINNVTKFLERPVKLIEDIDGDNDLMYEFYLLLATIDFTDAQNISLLSLENALDEYKFINLTKDTISELLDEILKEKIDSIKKYDYLEIMEKMGKEFQYSLDKRAQGKLEFSEKDLDKPELKDFIYLITFVNILLKISDSILICHEKNIKVIKNNDVINSEYLNRNFFVLVNNLKLYFYQVMRIYYEQKQKFNYFILANDSKINILKQQNKDLSNQLMEKDNDENDKILNALYDEIKAEKNKIDYLSKENQNLKQQNLNNNNKIYEYDNKIQEMNRIKKENEIKIISLSKERDLQAEKYKKVFDQLNNILYVKKEEERKTKVSLEKINLSNNLSYLVNLDKIDIISLVNDKEKNLTSLDKENKSLKNKVIELENKLKKNEDEINELNFKNINLKKKNESLQKEIEDSKKEIEEQTEKSFFLNSIIDDKVDKEDYDQLEYQFNQEKEKNLKMKKSIDKLNEDISKKEEEIIKSSNKINSLENIIKEKENQINNLDEQMDKNKTEYKELLDKYKNITTKIEEDERKLNIAYENLNLSEKYKQFIKMEKPDLIKCIIDKDTLIEKIEKENNSYKNEISDLNDTNKELKEEINKNKIMINNLNKNITNIENELKESNDEKNQLKKNLENKEEKLNKELEEKENIKNNLLNEKKKNELLINDNKNMKNEIISQNENISKANNEISLLQNKNKEKEEQIISLTKEKEILNKNYKDLFDKYNEHLVNSKKKEQRNSIVLQNLNLEKDKYLKMTEDLNKNLNEKIEKINGEKNSLEEECNKLKLNIVDLEKKNSLLNQEIEHMNKDFENLKTEKNNLQSDLNKEKEIKENYIKETEKLNEEIKELNEKINISSNEIKKLTEETITKNELIKNLENKITSLDSKLNEFKNQNSDFSKKYEELTEKSKNQQESLDKFILKEKTELDLISKLNLSNTYEYLSQKSKADLISLIIEKDNLNQKLQKEKTELNNKIIDLEKNLSDFEAKNNTLNNKIKNLENDINIMKKENESLIKEKGELNNLLKDEKKSGEKMKNINEL